MLVLDVYQTQSLQKNKEKREENLVLNMQKKEINLQKNGKSIIKKKLLSIIKIIQKKIENQSQKKLVKEIK